MPQTVKGSNAESANDSTRIILIGEDDIDDQEILKEIFGSVDSSYSLVFATNGTDILAHLDGCPDRELPCLIILDYNMPGLTGAEILSEIKQKQRYHSIPKIVWSTSGSVNYKRVCLDLGANDYFVKPSNISDLEEICRYMISTC